MRPSLRFYEALHGYNGANGQAVPIKPIIPITPSYITSSTGV